MKQLFLLVFIAVITASIGSEGKWTKQRKGIEKWLYTKPGLHYNDKVVSILKMISTLERTMKRLQCKLQCEQPFDYLFTNDRHHGNSCYEFLPHTLVNHDRARRLCEDHQARLVSIEAEDEMKHLQKTIEDKEELTVKSLFEDWAGYWTSGSDEKKEGHWMWGATGRKVTYTKWKRNEPNSLLPGEDYIAFSSKVFAWFDVIDSFKNAVICEKKAQCIPLKTNSDP